MLYSRVRVWRTLDYATTKEECTLESKSCLESVAAPAPAQNVTVSEFHAEAPQTTANEGLARGPYEAERAGFELTTFRTKDCESTNEPPRPLWRKNWTVSGEYSFW